MQFPTLWVGPAGCGKLTAARRMIWSATTASRPRKPRLQTLEIGDYAARFWDFGTHLEIDVMDLSMMDKQVLPEMLTQLLQTTNVTGKPKLLILRRIHALSPAAAARVRAVLETYMWSASVSASPVAAPVILFATARTVTSSVATLMDGFVFRRVVSPSHRRLDREAILASSGCGAAAAGSGAAATATAELPSVQSYIATMLEQMALALAAGPPCLDAIKWIRARVYEMLGLMVTGAELVALLSWSTVRMAASHSLPSAKAKRVLSRLARTRWIPSYRTPLMVEMILVDLYEALI